MRALGIAAAAILVTGWGGGCGKKDDSAKQQKITDLTTQLSKANDRESNLQKELKQLNERVVVLQNNFKIYSQKPCDYELDPIEYSIARKDGKPIQRSGTHPNGTHHPGMRAAPSGPPAELKDVKTKARQARRGIKRCYQEALKKNTSLQMGSRRVTLKFTVRPSGHMSQIMVIPPIGSGFEPCVRSLVSAWRFSKFKGPAQRFRLPMTLRPQ